MAVIRERVDRYGNTALVDENGKEIKPSEAVPPAVKIVPDADLGGDDGSTHE